jgi:O-antigen ligase
VNWTLPLVGLLIYTVVFTSVRAPFGDIAIGLALVGMALAPRRFRLPGPLAALAVFLLWVFGTSLRTEFPEWFGVRVLDLLKLWMITLVAYNALRTRAQIRVYMIFFLACFALWPVRGTLVSYFVLHEFDNEGRAAWIQLYSNPNDLANMALLQLSMAAALLTTERKRWVRLCAMTGMVVLPLVILLTQSRGVFLGLLAFIAIVFTGQRRKLRVALRVFAGVAILIAVTPAGVWNRLESLKRATSTEELAQVDGAQGSALQRYEIWRVATQIISDHPIGGVGFNAYKPTHFKYSADPKFDQNIHDYWDTHSLYLNVIAETGFVGLFLYLAYFIALAIPVDRIRRQLKGQHVDASRQVMFLEAGMIGFMVACVFGSLAYLPHLHLHLALTYSLAMAHRTELAGSMGISPLPHWPRHGLGVGLTRSRGTIPLRHVAGSGNAGTTGG